MPAHAWSTKQRKKFNLTITKRRIHQVRELKKIKKANGGGGVHMIGAGDNRPAHFSLIIQDPSRDEAIAAIKLLARML